MNFKSGLLITACISAIGFSVSSATTTHRFQAIKQLKLQEVQTAVTCNYCHISRYGGNKWNAFGTEIQIAYFDKAKGDISIALYQTLKARKDSDKDGFIDLLEIVAKTLPGDKNSRPTKTVVVLEAELKQLGGIEAFRR
ncbi:MAG: hypothetical protein RLZZ156_1806 [Deinococcota bacterium]|jgi:hypothetical protein